MCGQLCFAHEVTNPFTAPQTSRPLHQFSHGPRLSVWAEARKFGPGDEAVHLGEPARNLTRSRLPA